MDDNGSAQDIVLGNQRHQVVLNPHVSPALVICSNVPKITNMSGCIIIPRRAVC